MKRSKSSSCTEENREPISRKLIITNAGALRKKYGERAGEIYKAVEGLIRADRKRGLDSQVIELDSRSQMKRLKAPPVRDAMDCRENKDAIDGVYRSILPDYILILGARDVVPHHDARNPIYGPHDPDRYAYGDLAYASDAPYSQNPESFIGPTRVVGRLPDIPNSEDPSYLVGLLRIAAGWSGGKMESYLSYFAVSAYVWRNSTGLSLKRTFGADDGLNVSPPDGHKWKRSALSARAHFLNCHGAPADSRYYGERGSKYPVAHDAAFINDKIKEGTVVAAECCYGAELYDPMITEGQPGIPFAYLASKAYGFLGSSTIAYGPAEGNGAADLICRFFLSRVLEGASLGRAALLARQDFAEANPTLDPVDLKTLAQFVLLGDPSVHPVEVPPTDIGVPGAEDTMDAKALGLAAGRPSRRRHLARKGLMIGQCARYARKAARVKPAPALRKQLEDLAAESKMVETKILTYRVGGAAMPKGIQAGFAAAKEPGELFHVVAGRTKHRPSLIPDVTVLVARIENGDLKTYRVLQSR